MNHPKTDSLSIRYIGITQIGGFDKTPDWVKQNKSINAIANQVYDSVEQSRSTVQREGSIRLECFK